VTDDKPHDDRNKDDEGITFSGLTGHARLPAKMAEAMAPAAVWLVYSISASIFFYALCHGLSLIWK
jgi:hypothetical protein